MLYKRSNIYLYIIFLLNLSLVFAQVDKTNHNQKVSKDSKQHSATAPNTPQIELSEKVIIKKGVTILMEVEKESTAGSIKLEDAGAVSQKPNKLYNNGGNLYWGTEQLNTSDNDWTISGNNIYNPNSGNVGIGITNPLSKLSVGGEGNSKAAISGIKNISTGGRGVFGSAQNPGSVQNFGGDFKAGGTIGIGVRGVANSSTSTNYGGYFEARGTTGLGVYGLASHFDNHTNYGGYFEAYGNFGRGVYGRVSGSNGIAGYFNATGTSGIGIYATSTHHLAGQFDGDVFLNGNVGIGKIDPNYKLHVVDDSGGKEVVMIHNTKKEADSDGMIIRAGIDVDPTDATDYIIFQDGDGTTIGVIDGNGAGGVGFNHTSDRRLKTKIRDYTGALEKISQIQVRKYERKTAPGKELIGLIAQEVQKVYPQIVSGSPDGDLETDPMMVDYGRITPLLIKAIQEQQNKIEILEKKLTELSKYIGSEKFSNVSR